VIVVRVISLPASPRRAAMAAQLAALPGLNWSFFDAATTVPEWLRHDPLRVRQVIQRDMTPGELGCFASHATLWRWLAEQPQGASLIVLEDDLLIDPGFFGQLGCFDRAAAGIDYLRLHAKVPAGAKVIGRIGGRQLVRYRGIAFGTQAYLIRQPAAARLAASISAIERPIDDEMDRFWAHHVPNLGLFPFPVLEISGASTIEAVRRVPPRRWRYPGYEGRRIVESLRRRAANLRQALGLPL
jgi:glycosyl transferase family 25